MTYASGTAVVSGRTSAPHASSALPAFRRPKRRVGSASSERASDLAHHSVETHAQALALEEMFLTSRTKFVAIAYSILRNREDAEDAVQDAFLSGYRHVRSFEGRSALKTWFTRIVLNAALMIQRKRKTSNVMTVPENTNANDVNLESLPAAQPDPETAHAEGEIFSFINGVLGKMKPILRQVFTMTYFEELSGPEACALLGISTATFKARLFRARSELLKHARRAHLAPMHKASPSYTRILKNVDDSRIYGT